MGTILRSSSTGTLQVFSSLLLLATILASLVRADDPSVVAANRELRRQIEILETIRPYVELPDLAKLVAFRNASARVLESLGDPERGPLHQETNRAYHSLLTTYRNSRSFFEQISTERTKDLNREIIQIADDIARRLGFEHGYFTQSTRNTFTQMHRLVLQILDFNIPSALKNKLDDLKVPLGQLVGSAIWDNLPTFRAALPVCRQIRSLYSDFRGIAASHPASEITLEIQGLNEIYIENAGLEEDLRRPSP